MSLIKNWVLGSICLGYFCLSVCTLRVFPPVNGDEVSNTVYGYNLLHHQGLRNHLMDDVFEPSLASIHDAGFELTRILYNPLVGLWTLVAGRTYAQVRLLSTLLNAITLVLFYLIGARLANRAVGLAAAFLLAVQPLFSPSCC